MGRSKITKCICEFQALTAKQLELERKEDVHPKNRRFWLLNMLFDFSISIFILTAVTLLVFYGMSVTVCPKGFGTFLPHRGQCYLTVNESMNWSDSMKYCNEKGGYLLEIYTNSELDYILKLIRFSNPSQKVHYWLGASEQRDANIFFWEKTERTTSIDIAWADGFPSKTMSTTCLSLIYNEKFVFINSECYEKRKIFCKVLSQNGIMDTKQEGNNSLFLCIVWDYFCLQ